MSRLRLIVCTAVFAALSFTSTALADKLNNKYTPEQVKSACAKVGGEFFPQGQTGTYGCENRNNGAMVLCNRNNDCWGYNQTRKRKENKKIVGHFQLDACPSAQ